MGLNIIEFRTKGAVFFECNKGFCECIFFMQSFF